MTDSLTTLIGKVQNILGDASGTYFTTAICTAAIRQALSDWNMRAPMFAAVTITAVTNQYEYELSDEDANAIEIIDILRQGPNNNEVDKSLDYDGYIEDERVFFRLRRPLTSADTIIVRYILYHTINGLDSQVESTLPSYYNQAMVDGGAFFAIMIRATARIETINLSPEQSDNYREIAGGFAQAFALRMAEAQRKRSAAVSEPDSRAWNDAYHTNQWEMK
jgi:hypothetical protein